MWPRTKKAREAHEKLEKGGGGSHKGQGGGGGVPTLPQPSWPCVRRWPSSRTQELKRGPGQSPPAPKPEEAAPDDDPLLMQIEVLEATIVGYKKAKIEGELVTAVDAQLGAGGAAQEAARGEVAPEPGHLTQREAPPPAEQEGAPR